ncbi:MAG: deoxyribodipyrimidine photolyase [Gemmatimonadota bacterium]|nr:MAG: deoxyribodipyrimidine photolyase [Gemmatimonadota bacterium]
MAAVPATRVTNCNQAPVHRDRDYVLYWMIASRRTTWNFGLQRALEWCRELRKPLLVLEPLRCGYRWASRRLHQFIIDGMTDNSRRFDDSSVYYYAYLERRSDDGHGLLAALAACACVVVTDDYPAFFLPRMVSAAAERLDVRLEKVDSNGLLPLRATDRVFETAYSFRRFLQKALPEHLEQFPLPDPVAGARIPKLTAIPSEVTRRWPNAAPDLLAGHLPRLADFAIDSEVATVETAGGSEAANNALERFVSQRLAGYSELRNHPDEEATSGLSPYLHFGHISSHQFVAELMAREGWDRDRLSGDTAGKRSGWWGMSESAEAVLDQIVTWRELGFNSCVHREGHDEYESLPGWARETLAEHVNDERPHLYALEELERARTHDDVWNAAQTQLLRDGQLHNYLRMLWGKKILEWSPTPETALSAMIELNNKYALDGRDPNSYSGIFWCLGRYDRPWGPERPIFGKIRYMSSENTVRKLRLSEYLGTYGTPGRE